MSKNYLVLVRHGQSEWNAKNLFTGWVDIDLSPVGKDQAKKAGQLLKSKEIKFDYAFTSVLKRAIRTLWIILDEMDRMWIPVTKSWHLNERHYGALQGQNKKDVEEKYGTEQFMKWRRDFKTSPPLISKAEKNSKVCLGESLKQTQDRVLPFFKKSILPQIKNNKSVLITAHGNSLRALVKFLENISDTNISTLNIETGVPFIYSYDPESKEFIKENN